MAARSKRRASGVFIGMASANATHDEGDRQHGDGHESGGGQSRIDGYQGAFLQALDDISGQPNDVIADRRDGQALDCLLKAQLKESILARICFSLND